MLLKKKCIQISFKSFKNCVWNVSVSTQYEKNMQNIKKIKIEKSEGKNEDMFEFLHITLVKYSTQF